MATERRKKWYGRNDGYRIKTKGVNRMMPYSFKKRSACEVFDKMVIDVTHTLEYLKTMNGKEGYEHNVKIFHCVVAATVKLLHNHEHMNRFIRGKKMYLHDTVTVAFIIKRENDDIDAESSYMKSIPGYWNIEDPLDDKPKLSQGRSMPIRTTSTLWLFSPARS